MAVYDLQTYEYIHDAGEKSRQGSGQCLAWSDGDLGSFCYGRADTEDVHRADIMLCQFALAVHSAVHVFFFFSGVHKNKVAEQTVAESHLLRKRIPDGIGPADQYRAKAGEGDDQQQKRSRSKEPTCPGFPACEGSRARQ